MTKLAALLCVVNLDVDIQSNQNVYFNVSDKDIRRQGKVNLL